MLGVILLTYIQIIQLISFALLMSLGQILFKKTALSLSSTNTLGLIDTFLKALTSPWLYMALITYGLATICWLYILQRIPLTIAYPFSALAMVIVPIVAVLLFGERINTSYWIGLLLIIIGIITIAH
jgi:drug/metabolite transporter (DMT)-like permease